MCNRSNATFLSVEDDVQTERTIEVTVRKTESLAAVVINLAAERARRRAKIQVRGEPRAAPLVPGPIPNAAMLRHQHPRSSRNRRWGDE